ncbi:MAG: hypothetical protein MJ131_00910 [Lachnospiraceae bacterium]|nr:hypothetical protein [Lachnospiraceae bacterium]
MEYNKRASIVVCLVIMVLLCLFGLFSCLSEKEDAEMKTDLPVDITNEITPVPTKVFVIDDKQDGNSGNKKELITIRYYAVSSSNAPNQAAEVVVEANEKISPEMVMEYFTDSLEDEEIDLKINSVTVKDKSCTVDFDSSVIKIAEKSAITEVHILDAISMSILDNCENLSEVLFTIDKKPYSTPNITFNEGEVYLSN